MQTSGRQLPSGIQVFENLRDGSHLHDDVQEVVYGHVGDRHAQVFQRQISSYFLEVNRTPRFHHCNSVDYAGERSEFNSAPAWVLTPLGTVVRLPDCAINRLILPADTIPCSL